MAARFDFAREHDFILALEQRHRMDTTHVERHRIGGRTAPRARSPSSARLSSSVSRSTSTGVADERRGRGRLVEHVDADVRERGAHDFQGIGAVAVGRQRVDEVGVRRISLLAGAREQLDDRIEGRVRPKRGAWQVMSIAA
jgi:hypothetical protein